MFRTPNMSLNLIMNFNADTLHYFIFNERKIYEFNYNYFE